MSGNRRREFGRLTIDLAADEDGSQFVIGKARRPGTIVGFIVACKDDEAVAGTNYQTIALKNGTTTVATFNTNTGGQAFTAGDPVEIAIVSEDLAIGDVLTIEPTLTGAGRAIPGMTFIVEVLEAGENLNV